MADERQGFLGRWARRKTDVLQGKPVDEPVLAEKAVPVPVASTATAPAERGAPVSPAAPDVAQTPAPPEKMLSLDDVKQLTQDSDFKPFMARDVGPEVRNAAMKKLFTDPHYNVMDGLDIYIDDYSKSDPIPESMLRQMVSAKFLNLFEEEDSDKDGDLAAAHNPVAPDQPLNNPTPESVAQSGELPGNGSPQFSGSDNTRPPEPTDGSGASPHDDHANPYLRLQPDHAPSAPDAGRAA